MRYNPITNTHYEKCTQKNCLFCDFITERITKLQMEILTEQERYYHQITKDGGSP